MLDSLRDGLQKALQKLVGASAVDETVVKEFVRNLQRTLIQADVSVKLALSLTERVQKRALEEKPLGGITRKDQIVTILYEELAKLLGGEGGLQLDRNKANVIVMLGIQGSGKTTTTGKLARYFTKRGHRVGLVAADTFRPGAVAQLKTIAGTIGVEIYSDEKERDSIKIAKAGKKHFESTKNLIIIDTAGRHKEEKGLLDEMKKIVSEVKPDVNILVIDGTIGQQGYNQALAFHQTSPVGGIIVTKLDGAAKGGGALAAVAATGTRILYIGTGERVDDLEEFSGTRFVGRLLGMGDIKALIEMAKQAEVVVDEKQVKRMMSGKLTMDDLLAQFEQLKKFGSFKKVVEHIPGVSGSVKTEDLEKAEDRAKVYKVIIQSMTKVERENPDKINAPRIKRIAFGSGTTEKDVRELLTRYKQTKNLMKSGKNREFRQLMRRMGGQ
ncbi:MAG: signal recognition particle receptor subunit alpha [Thaumarchaeota archaeon]|nr:signal recognition particle receptor subunit alpha [Nitrososphaerota archaeon]